MKWSSSEELQEIVATCRRDFEDNNTRVSNDWLKLYYRSYFPERVSSDIGLDIDLRANRPQFPRDNCEHASVYLRHFVGGGDIIDGTYIDTDSREMPHSFLYIGETALAEETIADITADQFGGPAVYVGPLVLPWQREAPQPIHLPRLYSLDELL